MEPIYVTIREQPAFVDCADFSFEDLNIFADSIETISSIKKERQERRQRRRNLKLDCIKLTVEAEIHPTPSSITTDNNSEAAEEDDLLYLSKSVSAKQLRCKLFASNPNVYSGHSSDENYYSGASGSESPTTESKESMDVDGITVLPSSDSGTESESGGVYQLRPRSAVMTNPKYRSTRARIIGLVLKREYTEGGGSQDELEKQERRERVLEDLLREKKKCESMHLTFREKEEGSIRGRSRKKHTTPEMKFIDKALRYLTL